MSCQAGLVPPLSVECALPALRRWLLSPRHCLETGDSTSVAHSANPPCN